MFDFLQTMPDASTSALPWNLCKAKALLLGQFLAILPVYTSAAGHCSSYKQLRKLAIMLAAMQA